MPDAAEHVWLWFNEISNKRAWADGFPQPIIDSELLVWCHMSGRRLKLWEYKAINRLDISFRNYIITKRRKEEDD